MMPPSSGVGGQPPSGTRRPTIVVIDDSDIVLAAAQDILEKAGYRVLTRNRPAGCVAMILQEKPDLVLLDVCMPTVSGDTLVKLFGRASPNSKTVVLLYSALDEPLLRSKAKAAGAHGYITKSSDPAALLRAVKRWLRIPMSESRVGRLADTRVASPAPPSSTRRRMSLPPASSRGLETRGAPAPDSRRMSGAEAGVSPTVLLVDDDMLVLSGFRRQLCGHPFQFEFALSGSQALRVLTSPTPPSVVVSDLMMPQPDGSEVLRRALDQDDSWGHRFVIVTAQPLQDAKRQLDARFRGPVLRKPVDTEALASAIQWSLAGGAGTALAAGTPR
jgi:CheY-like chemotaxis protein